jgi:hypothetical protein
VAGLAAWVGDRRLRLTVWPALLDEDGEITRTTPTTPMPTSSSSTSIRSSTARRSPRSPTARVLIAGPETGPTPLVLDLDRELAADAAPSPGAAG